MATEIRVPTLGESVSEATIGRWFKKAGDTVKADEPLCELETDKVTLEVNAPAAGVLSEITAKDGETVTPGAILGQISADSAGAAPAPAKPAPKPAAAKAAPAKTASAKAAPAASAVQGIETGAGYGNHADPAPEPVAPAMTAGGGTDIKVPTLGESVSEATVAKWFKKPGDAVKADEPLCELETDKVTLEVNAPASGVLSVIGVEAGATVTPGAVLGQIAAGAAGVAATPVKAANGAAAPQAASASTTMPPAPSARQNRAAELSKLSQALVKRMTEGSGISPANVGCRADGKDGRIFQGRRDRFPGQALAPAAATAHVPAAPKAGAAAERCRTRRAREA